METTSLLGMIIFSFMKLGKGTKNCECIEYFFNTITILHTFSRYLLVDNFQPEQNVFLLHQQPEWKIWRKIHNFLWNLIKDERYCRKVKLLTMSESLTARCSHWLIGPAEMFRHDNYCTFRELNQQLCITYQRYKFHARKFKLFFSKLNLANKVKHKNNNNLSFKLS